MLKITVDVDGMQCGMCENHVNEAVRGAFPVKKVSSSHSKKQTVIITEQDIDEQELKAVIDGTGYESGAVKKEPYEKKRAVWIFEITEENSHCIEKWKTRESAERIPAFFIRNCVL